jgi:hypothetical protein
MTAQSPRARPTLQRSIEAVPDTVTVEAAAETHCV